MPELITIATANTQMGRAIREPGGLRALAGIDVILLQEVRMHDDELDARLGEETGMKVGFYEDESGLAIAVDPKHSVSPPHLNTLQGRGPIGHVLYARPEKWDNLRFRLRARSLLGLTVETPHNNQLTVATTHPIVQARPRSRAKQVRAMLPGLSEMSDPLVLAGDMNHWPGPHKTDRLMYEESGLIPIEIPGSSFDFTESRFPLLGKLLPIKVQLDAMLYRGEGLHLVGSRAELVDIPSDHRAVVATFEIGE